MSTPKVYSDEEINNRATEIVNHLASTFDDIDVGDLMAITLYASAYIVHKAVDPTSDAAKIIRNAAGICVQFLQIDSIPETTNSEEKVATVPESPQSSEVQSND